VTAIAPHLDGLSFNSPPRSDARREFRWTTAIGLLGLLVTLLGVAITLWLAYTQGGQQFAHNHLLLGSSRSSTSFPVLAPE
jgi:hypothetical protein